jgi:CubicO group peptidase (beta-lactamase class C family)
VLLGLIVERASGMDLADVMHKRIFKPLGMTHTLM